MTQENPTEVRLTVIEADGREYDLVFDSIFDRDYYLARGDLISVYKFTEDAAEKLLTSFNKWQVMAIAEGCLPWLAFYMDTELQAEVYIRLKEDCTSNKIWALTELLEQSWFLSSVHLDAFIYLCEERELPCNVAVEQVKSLANYQAYGLLKGFALSTVKEVCMDYVWNSENSTHQEDLIAACNGVASTIGFSP